MYRKELFYRGLAQLPIYIEDTLQNSPYYFNIVEIPKVFGPGKNSIRFNLNENNLDIYNDVDVEIIDSYGNTVYHETPEYFQSDEANIRVLTVFLYGNISNGPLQITFIGHAKTGINGEEIPDEFKNKYNVRYTTTVDFNRFQKNTSRILFATSPSISITEARTSYVSRSLGPLDTVTVSGSGIYRYQYSYPLLDLPSGKSFTNDMLNGTLILTGSSIQPDFSGYATSSFNIFNSRISNIYKAQVAILSTPWTASILNQGTSPSYGLVNNANVNYTLTYNPTPNYTPINNFKSFINLKISNLDPASGYLKYIKLYGKSQGSLDQYELIGESLTEDSELLINSSSYTQFDRSNVGYFLNTSSFQSFWNYNNTYLSASFNTSSLFNSLYLTPLVDTTLNNVLFTSNVDINFQKGSSYRLYINYVKDTNFILEVYMSGSAFIDKTGIGQRVFYLDSSNFGPSYLNFPIDFLAPQTGTGRLQFKIVTGSFYISDISLKSGVDQGFNPSNFNSYFPINVKNRNDVYDFKVDFIDDNNQINSYEFDNTGAVNIQVSGSNQYISGNDNLLPGRLNLGESPDGGISLNGNTNTISTHGYTSGSGWIFWSGSQSISGSNQPGSGFYFETGPPYNHYIKAAVGGQVEMSGSVSGGGGTTIDTGSFVKTGSFNEFTSSINNFTSSISSSISSINNFTSSINNATSSFVTTSSFNDITGSFATTGSNTFDGNQIITGSLSNGLNTIASGFFSHAEGESTTAAGQSSHAEGTGTIAFGSYSHAEGIGTIASGESSHAEGTGTIAFGSYSHAEGESTTASGQSSHAEGTVTIASGFYSHAEGESTTASGESSHAEGQNTIARGNYSHAEGIGTIASGSGQTVVGKYNKQNNNSSLFIIGNGTDDANRNNLVLFNTSSVEISGSLIVNNRTLPAIDTLVTTSSLSSINNFTSSIRDTNLGTLAGYPGGLPFTSSLAYSKPSGYQAFVIRDGSTGLPDGAGSYLAYNVIGRRDYPDIFGGYFATLSDSNNMWFTYNLFDYNYPTWIKIQTTDAFNAATSSFTTTTSFNSYTSSISSSISSINNFTSSINNATSSFTTTSSFNNFTSSINNFTSSISSSISSINNFTSSINNATSSFVTTSSFNDITGSFATTGSNTFDGNQIISGSITTNTSYVSLLDTRTALSGSRNSVIFQYDQTKYVGGSIDVHIKKEADKFCLYNLLLTSTTSSTAAAVAVIGSASFGDISSYINFSQDISSSYVRLIVRNSDDSVDYEVKTFPRLMGQ